MKTRLCLLAFAAIASAFLVTLRRPAIAQSERANVATEQNKNVTDDNDIGRFQISAFSTDKSGSGVGYYIIDTTTGAVWMNFGDNKPSKVSEALAP